MSNSASALVFWGVWTDSDGDGDDEGFQVSYPWNGLNIQLPLSASDVKSYMRNYECDNVPAVDEEMSEADERESTEGDHPLLIAWSRFNRLSSPYQEAFSKHFGVTFSQFGSGDGYPFPILRIESAGLDAEWDTPIKLDPSQLVERSEWDSSLRAALAELGVNYTGELGWWVSAYYG